MLYIMRHGKTEWNAKIKLQGQTDIPLNEEGRQMAIVAREKYKDMKFDLCFASPLCRARETAELFLEGTGTPIKLDDRIKEINFGEYEGVEGSFQIPDLNVNTFFWNTPAYVPDKGAESVQELYARTGEFLKEEIYTRLVWNEENIKALTWEKAADGRTPFRYGNSKGANEEALPVIDWPVLADRSENEPNILIVGHGAMNCSIINQIWGIPLDGYWNYMHDNCELIRLI